MSGVVTTTYPGRGLILCSWAALTGGENGNSADMAHWPDKTVQVSGTFTSVTIQGSNDKTNWIVLNDPQGVDLVLTAPGMAQIAENPLYIRPVIVGGGAGALVLISGAGN